MVEKRVKRRLAAILVADVVGYSRLMGRDEVGTLATLKGHQTSLIAPAIAEHQGRIVKLMGDGLLAEFASVVDAVECAAHIQRAIVQTQSDGPDSLMIRFRMGVNLGDIILDDDDIYGDGVNIAARLEGLADAGGICISGPVYDQVKNKLDMSFEDLGRRDFKNITEPVRVYRWLSEPAEAVAKTQSDQDQRLPDKPSIAVLPFDNMSGDPEQDYFSDGIVEDIITALSRLDQLFVISRHSSFTYKGRSVDVRQVSGELGVRYVLEGSVRKAGKRVRITGQLIDGASGAHLWADRFDGHLEDIFDLQDQITEGVVAAIEPTLRKAEIERSRKKRPENLESYDLYLRALPHTYAMQPDDNSEALSLLHKAIDLDPNYAPALAYAAWCYEQRLTRGWETAENSDAATSICLARKVLATNSDDANALATAGFVLVMLDRDYDAGLSAVERALSINPNTAPISMFAGWANTIAGRADVALSCFERAMRLSPTDPTSFLFLTGTAYAYMFSGEPEMALDIARKSMVLNPCWDATLQVMAAAAAQLDQPTEARKAVEKLLEFTPHATVSFYQKLLPYDPNENLEMILEGLRLGGLPE